jgi:hypothetical protein
LKVIVIIVVRLLQALLLYGLPLQLTAVFFAAAASLRW